MDQKYLRRFAFKELYRLAFPIIKLGQQVGNISRSDALHHGRVFFIKSVIVSAGKDPIAVVDSDWRDGIAVLFEKGIQLVFCLKREAGLKIRVAEIPQGPVLFL